MLVGAHDLAQRGGAAHGAGEAAAHLFDHALEALDLAGKAGAARLGPFEAKAELEVFFISDQHAKDKKSELWLLSELL